MQFHITPSEGALQAIRRLESQGFEAYAVGGCVRDSLLGRTPHDWDLTTNALPEQTSACFSDCRVIETGIKHGTVTVLLNGEPLEITTYRQDGAYADNRHPTSVTFSKTISDDLSRRDFTVNAMAYHPERGLVDLFHGMDDLHAEKIRCVGNPRQRFEEDGLRILRAIRFASVLGFTLENQTSVQVHTQRHLLKNIAQERIREEFNKLLTGKNPAGILREYTDVMLQFIPEFAPCVGFAQNSKYHCYDVWEHILHALEFAEQPDLLLRLGILLHDIGKPSCYTEDSAGGHFKGHAESGVEIADKLLRRLKYDNATRETLLKLIHWHDLPLSAEPKLVKRLLLKFSETEIRTLLDIQTCDRLAHAPAYRELPPALQQIPEVIEQIKIQNSCFSLKTLAVNGNDLLALGIPSGKKMGEILQTLLNLVIDGDLPNEKPTLLQKAEQLTK